MTKFIRTSLITLLILLISLSLYSADLHVHFIDVGQGDSILIQHQDTAVLIDGGDRFAWVAETLTAYLREQGVEVLDAILSTHPHADHIGGLTAVLEAFPVLVIYDSGMPHTTQTFFNYLNTIDELNIPYYTPRRGDVIEIGELEFQVLHPADDVEEYSLNNASIVIRLEYGEISFLFTGDAEVEAEEEILESGLEVRATVLKVGHHGSRTSSTPPFLDTVQPEVSIIMCGLDNRFGHPHSEVLEAMAVREIDVYRTDLHGHIVVTTVCFFLLCLRSLSCLLFSYSRFLTSLLFDFFKTHSNFFNINISLLSLFDIIQQISFPTIKL